MKKLFTVLTAALFVTSVSSINATQLPAVPTGQPTPVNNAATKKVNSYSLTVRVSSEQSAVTEVYVYDPITNAQIYSAGFGGSGSFSTGTQLPQGLYTIKVVRKNGKSFNVRIGTQTNNNIATEVTNYNVYLSYTDANNPLIDVY